MSLSRLTLKILLLTAIASTVSGALELTITPDRGSTLNISNTDVKGCKVCTGAARSRQCSASLLLKDNTPVSVEFDCSKPQDVFNVEIVKNIECTAKSCTSHIIQSDSGSLPLLGFNRKFTWNLKASVPTAFKIDFSKTGLRQINASDSCADRHSYTLRAFQTTGDVTVGKYCITGPISSVQILNRGSFSLDVPAGQKLQNGRFDVSVGEEIKSLAKITLTLPKETSSAELLSPNYPDSFPDDDVMEWYFQVPDKHKTSVQFLKHGQPSCLKKDTAVEYHNKGRGALVLRLTDPQPEHNLGNFSLTLRNCEMDRRRAGSPGLSLNFKVVSSSISSPVLCKVDVSKMEGLTLHIEKLRPASDCEMKINSVLTETITVTSNSDLSFQDCLPEDVRVTALRVIGCNQLKECPKTINLWVPVRLPTCLPAPLSSVTWTLRPPEHGTVELTSPTVYLKQCVPWLPCNDSVIIKLVEDERTTVGHFCPQGAIQKVQIRTHNVSVTVSSTGDEALIYKNVLIAKMKEEISERYIFTVVPKRDTPVFLASPGWPAGMESYSTASWIISVPPKMDARLVFANISQPKCSNRHTSIKIQRVGHLEEDYSRREDEEAESEITVSESFYFNMSNCMSERGHFSAVTKITLQKSKNLLLTILSVVAALLVIFVIVLVVVCVVIRKKKKMLNHQVSIYNPNGTVFLPGQNGLPETRDDHSEHEYASIEDTLVYTHLLRKGREIGMYGEFDTYRPFTGHTDSTKPLFSKNSDAKEMQQLQSSSQEGPPLPVRPLSHGKRLVDNEIYQAEGQSEDEHSPALGPRMEPEGGN
ncbi:CUB domain-containing protein 1a [Larimichthys crocea]|uniref:CUB domain-containing protein 1a n=1 Tax=Larimichthys crocea TaxID=215358 RepID=UPI000F5E9125|nr:CUB domain-containing protein 1 [Larimichthys crocea]